MKKYLILLYLIALSLPSSLIAQDIDAKEYIVGNTQREEIQRYFGYEILPYRYISLPFDLSVNSNEGGVFVDIGFIYFAFLPLFVLLYLLRKKKFKYFYGFLSTLLLVWIVGACNSYFYSHSGGLLKSSEMKNITDYLLGPIPIVQEPLAHFVAYIYYLCQFIYKPLLLLADSFSGESDFVTYPLLVSLFILSCLFLDSITAKFSASKKVLVYVFWIFFFFWIKFSAGIVWYGFPVLVLGLIIISLLIKSFEDNPSMVTRALKYSYLSIGSIWICSAILFRMGEVHNGSEEENLGKAIYSPWFFKYQSGVTSESEILEAFYPQFNKSLAKMNSESETNIWRIGSSFSYFIKNNTERVLKDNQLGVFNYVNLYYDSDKEVINNVLKASNFKYIIVDVNTPYIDKTPEGSLKKKYKDLKRYIKNNSGLRLLCTNRVFQEKDPHTGKVNLYYKMFPSKERESKIYYGGQYAIYEIL